MLYRIHSSELYYNIGDRVGKEGDDVDGIPRRVLELTELISRFMFFRAKGGDKATVGHAERFCTSG